EKTEKSTGRRRRRRFSTECGDSRRGRERTAGFADKSATCGEIRCLIRRAARRPGRSTSKERKSLLRAAAVPFSGWSASNKKAAKRFPRGNSCGERALPAGNVFRVNELHSAAWSGILAFYAILEAEVREPKFPWKSANGLGAASGFVPSRRPSCGPARAGC